MHISRRVSFRILLVACIVANSAFAVEAPFVVKTIGGQQIRMPLIAGMIAACDQDREFAARMAGMTPSSSEFLTCFATPATAQAIKQQARSGTYPLIAAVVVREQGGAPLTAKEFAQIRDLAKQQMAGMVTAAGSQQAELDRQDAANAAKGGTLKRKSSGIEFGGFHEYTGVRPSFTYVVTRKTTVSEAGASQPMCEVNAASSVFINGRMLGIMVIDHCAGTPSDRRATSLSREWLMAFEKMNSAAK